jgi:subtilase family serine protease
MRKKLCYSLLLMAAGATYGAAAAAPATPYVIANNTPRFVATAKKVGDVDASQVMDVTLWLTPHNRAALDSLTSRLYDRSSAQYHHWLDRDTLHNLIAPSTEEVTAVSKFLEAHNLTVVGGDKFNLMIRARGTAAAMQQAFNTKLAYVSFRGKTLRTNLTDPEIADPAGALVMAIEGLDDAKFEHPNIAQNAAIKGLTTSAGKGVTEAATDAISDKCITGTGTQIFTSGGSEPNGIFTGNIYNASNTGCGYTPAQIQAAYGLTALYKKSLNGAGQTIVIVDWCGSPTITGDANAFSAKYGLPALTASNFSIVDYPGTSTCAAEDAEINIDVEWSHAIAPGANILLLVPATANFSDIDASWLYIIENGAGNIVSNSYGSEEIFTSTSVLQLQNYILEVAASSGINFNFSSGDDGDYTFDFPQFDPPSVSAPADSPYATAVGGISLALSAANAIQWQAAWGTNETLLADGGFVPVPAENFGFNFGSGGGNSVEFKKPSFQSALKGAYRHVPDISWLADPFTGGIIAISVPFQSPALIYTVYGGTSLACPMFAGLWAIANQAAGASLGEAAPLLYGAPASVITDVVPVGSSSNVTATYQTANGTTNEGAPALAQPLRYTKVFQSAIWDYPAAPGEALVLTFGTDSGLPALPGYDYATGLGVANPGALITYVTPTASAAAH